MRRDAATPVWVFTPFVLSERVSAESGLGLASATLVVRTVLVSTAMQLFGRACCPIHRPNRATRRSRPPKRRSRRRPAPTPTTSPSPGSRVRWQHTLRGCSATGDTMYAPMLPRPSRPTGVVRHHNQRMIMDPLRTSRPMNRLASGAAATVAAAIVAVALDAGIAAIAHAAGVPHGFNPLHLASYAGLTILGVVLAAAAWAIIRARSATPRLILSRLVPGVVALSLVPDLILGLSKQEAHTTWGGVVALMLMHLAVTAVAVPAFVVSMPLRDTARPV